MPDLLTLKQLAEHLQLSERTVYRLLGRGQLPGFKVGGHWRFRRSVVDYWLDVRLARMDPATLREMEDEWTDSNLSLADALAPENALIMLSAGSRQEIVGQFIRAVTFPEPVDPEQLVDRVLQREELASTAVEGGVSFLHTARWDQRALRRTNLLAIGRLPKAMDFGAIDEWPTDLLLLLLARDSRHQLVLLAKATQLCRQPGFLSRLRAVSSSDEAVAAVRDAERALLAAT